MQFFVLQHKEKEKPRKNNLKIVQKTIRSVSRTDCRTKTVYLQYKCKTNT